MACGKLPASFHWPPGSSSTKILSAPGFFAAGPWRAAIGEISTAGYYQAHYCDVPENEPAKPKLSGIARQLASQVKLRLC
jgi:hypothetical protein